MLQTAQTVLIPITFITSSTNPSQLLVTMVRDLGKNLLSSIRLQ